MGGRSVNVDDLWARVKVNRYVDGAHTDIDNICWLWKYATKTGQDHDQTLRRYVQ